MYNRQSQKSIPPGLPAPEYSRAPPKRYWRNKHGPIYVCIGPYAKQGSETGLSNIFEDLKSFCYRSDNHIIVRVFF